MSLDHDQLNQFSCTTCRQRKTKCNKRSPCSGCQIAQFDCVYPPVRHSRRRKKTDSNEILKARLEKLENLVQGLSRDARKIGTKSLDGSSLYAREPGEVRSPKRELGRLVVEEGESRYIENSFWVALSNEVSGIRNLLEDSDDDTDITSGAYRASPSEGTHAYVYSFNSLDSNLTQTHPTPDKILFLWQIFKENVDPVVRILHKPSMQTKVMRAKDSLDEMSKPFEALMFAMYFASVTSMTEEQCFSAFKESKAPLLSRYRFGVEQGLARAGFLSTHNMVTLQALVIFLVCERNHDDTSLVWTLTAVAIRIAQSLGIHRDGNKFNLSHFENEMRSRLWWQICILDVRTAENHGSDQDVAQQHFDTKLPLNINDEELIPGSIELPTPRVGVTEMTLSLIRYEIISVLWRLRLPHNPTEGLRATSSVEMIDSIIEDCSMRLQSQYLKYCDLNVPFHWLIATVARMMMAKVWINAHHRYQLGACEEPLPQGCKNRIFSTSLEVVDSCLLLERQKSTKHWRWAFRNYVPWQALAFILSELCTIAKDKSTDRAWTIVHNAFNEWADVAANKDHDMLWLRMKKLLAKAQRTRASDLTEVPQVERINPLGQGGNGDTLPLINSPISGDYVLPVAVSDPNVAAPSSISHYPSDILRVGTDSQGTESEEYQWSFDEVNMLNGIDEEPFSLFNWATGMNSQWGDSDDTTHSRAAFEDLDNWW